MPQFTYKTETLSYSFPFRNMIIRKLMHYFKMTAMDNSVGIMS